MVRELIFTVESSNARQDEKVELIKAYKSLSKEETYRVQLEYSKDTYHVCRVIITPSNSSETSSIPKSEGTLTTKEVNEFLRDLQTDTKTTTIIHYDTLLENLLQYLPFLICYILLLINVIVTKKSKNATNKKIWLYITLIAIISFFYFWLFCIVLGDNYITQS